MHTANLEELQGAVVLVESTADHHTPPTGMRGFLDVARSPGQPPQLQLIVEFPQMFGTRAHRLTLALNDAEIARLLASERNGSFEFVLDRPLDPVAENVPPAVLPIS
jgi:hypothetical protein